MWIVTNKSFLSIVEDRNDKTNFVVRARVDGDLEEFLKDDDGNMPFDVFISDQSDYRFRAFVDKAYVVSRMEKVINNIDYDNFKNSVKDTERKYWYTQIWGVMFNVQEKLYGIQEWWNARYDKNFQRTYTRKQRGR